MHIVCEVLSRVCHAHGNREKQVQVSVFVFWGFKVSYSSNSLFSRIEYISTTISKKVTHFILSCFCVLTVGSNLQAAVHKVSTWIETRSSQRSVQILGLKIQRQATLVSGYLAVVERVSRKGRNSGSHSPLSCFSGFINIALDGRRSHTLHTITPHSPASQGQKVPGLAVWQKATLRLKPQVWHMHNFSS